jgi:PhnB protein
MASRLNPYLSFDGSARQAMDFYKSVFGGELTVSTYGEFGAADTTDTMSAVDANKIMHSQLETPSGFTIMGSDNPPGTPYQPGNNISISLSGDDAGELHGYWEKLSGSGTVMVPLEKQMWGDEFGMCGDQFGITWMVNIGQPNR